MVARSIFILTALLCSISVAPLPQSAAASTDDSTVSPADAEGASLEQLLLEAQNLFMESRPIDARSKLLKALQLAPNDYRPHMLLGAYYLSEVAHFQLAYRYLRTAEMLFEKRFGIDHIGLEDEAARDRVRLLYFLSESELNLDKYAGALKTLDRCEQCQWQDWYPGARAWILMKLKRVDEAIGVAQAGLLRGSELGRTYNILGILLSLKGSRELSLDAFRRAIRAELSLGGNGQVATPLNNAGEVYRELFRDELAEAAWLRAIGMPDGCEHILPSLNLTIMYIDQLRLFQAERLLTDFEACFASRSSSREDSEHRALLALARGKIALRKGDVDAAITSLGQAAERQQWFGKIGTNENDVRFATTVTMAQAYEAKAAALRDVAHDGWMSATIDRLSAPLYRLRAWWLGRRARQIALEELNDFEDLHIRNTDTMLEYSTLGWLTAGFPERSFERRLARMEEEDQRRVARAYYDLYEAENAAAAGDHGKAIGLYQRSLEVLRPELDRLARADALAGLIESERNNSSFIARLTRQTTNAERLRELRTIEEIFELLPSHVRYHSFALPVIVSVRSDSEDALDVLETARAILLRERFTPVSPELESEARYVLQISSGAPASDGKVTVQIALSERASKQVIASVNGMVPASNGLIFRKGAGPELTELLNKFIGKAFAHRVDPPGVALPKLELLEGLLKH